MSTHATSGQAASDPQAVPWATGFAMFAGVLMIVGGVWGVLVGISAVLHDTLYVATPDYLYEFDITRWAWVHLILGVLVVAAGAGVMRGVSWARYAGMALAGVSALANFAFIPYFPVWSILIIALDVIVIWALATYRSTA